MNKTFSGKNYKTTFHRDGTITVWDVYQQRWRRTRYPSDMVLASLPEHERRRVIRHCKIDCKIETGE